MSALQTPRSNWHNKARATGDYAAAAAAMRSVIAASRETGRLNGAYAPDQIVMGATTEVPVQLDVILAVLSEAGLAALEVVNAEIEAAKADGRLKLELER